MQKRVFGIFAHNEARNIISSIERIQCECNSNIYVLINGCSDSTQSLVEEYGEKHKNVKPIVIKVGDKSNAWNVFVHTLNIDAELYYFLDGDCTVVKGALDEIEIALEKNTPNAVAATPEGTTKNRRKTAKNMLESGGLAGNFYVLTKQFIDRIRIKSIKLPIGTIGEDGLVGALAYWDLKPFSEWNLKNILVLENANFAYTPLSPFSLDDIKLYYRRKIRYSCRFFQNKIITESFRDDGLKWLNGHFNDRYDRYPKHLKITWRGIDTYFDWLALSEIKEHNKKRGFADSL